MFQGIAVNDQDLPEDGPNPMAAALATGALANATADEDGMAQDDTPVAVCDVVLDDAELLDDDEFGTDDDMDEEFEDKGVKLYVDPLSYQYLDGTEIDYVEGLSGAGFKFNNPNVKSTCGCGSSFSV